MYYINENEFPRQEENHEIDKQNRNEDYAEQNPADGIKINLDVVNRVQFENLQEMTHEERNGGSYRESLEAFNNEVEKIAWRNLSKEIRQSTTYKMTHKGISEGITKSDITSILFNKLNSCGWELRLGHFELIHKHCVDFRKQGGRNEE